MAQLAHLGVEEGIAGAQLVEVLLCHEQQPRVDLGAHRSGARGAGQQRHLAECFAFAQRRHDPAVLVEHRDSAGGDDVERVADIVAMEHDLARLDGPLADPVEQRQQVLRRQMAQQLALGEGSQAIAGFPTLAPERVLQEARGIAHRCTLLLEEERRSVVDRGSGAEAAGDRRPSDVDVGAALGQLVRRPERQFDRQ